jgi:hypothetical protein
MRSSASTSPPQNCVKKTKTKTKQNKKPRNRVSSRRGSPPLKLRLVSLVHNLVLCLWSLAMFVGLSVGAWERFSGRIAGQPAASGAAGLYGALFCDSEQRPMRGVLAYWMTHYYLSKYYEYGDTLLMVLRRKPLTVLHVWHHASIGPLCLSWVLGDWTLAWFGAWLNTFIHVAMYWYYFSSSAFGNNPWWKKYITMMQIGQFFTVFATIVAFTFAYVRAPVLAPLGTWPPLSFTPACAGKPEVVIVSQLVNVSYLALFINFARKTYGNKGNKAKKTTKAE